MTSELSHLEGLLQLYGATAPTSSAAVSSPSQATADDVVELLRQTGGPLHYTAIESELRARGFLTAGGKNPANTLLARYFNDPRLTRPKRGTYTLRTEIRE